MPKKEKSSDSAKRWGARYGRKIRKKVSEIEELEKGTYECPKCRTDCLVRKGTGIWKCRKCDAEMAGGAYRPETSTGKAVKRTLRKEREEE